MKILTVHLSDIHFHSGKEPLLERTKALAAALSPIEREPTVLFIAVTGDIAQSGQPQEYEIAKKFFLSLKEQLKQFFPKAEIFQISVPGNHDCDLSINDPIRDLVIEKISASSEISPAYIRQSLTVQSTFFTFKADLGEHNVPNPMYWTEEYAIGNAKVLFKCINTAWMSKRDQPPAEIVFPPIPAEQSASELVITLFHHPYNWLTPDSGRNLREYVESSSDIILTGHEHISSQFQKHTDTKLCNYIEGGVLNDVKNPNSSEFSVILIDLENKSYKHTSFNWIGNEYKSKSGYGTAEKPFLRNLERLKNQYQLTDPFKSYIRDLGTVFTHPAKDTLYMYDVFIRPALKVMHSEEGDITLQEVIAPSDLDEFIKNQESLLILGDQKSGKTCLSKHVFSVTRENNLIPLLVDAGSLDKKNLDRKKLISTLNDYFNETYFKSDWNSYLQLEISRKCVILDNFDRCPLNSTGRSELIRLLKNEFGRVFIVADTILNFEGLADTNDTNPALVSFKQVEIAPLGNKQKLELIRKWLILGRENTYVSAELIKDLHHIEQIVKTIMTKELIPSYPLFVLMLLQQVESTREHTTTSGSYGHLFDFIISEALVKSNQGSFEINILKTYLSALAFHLFELKRKDISEADLKVFHADHCQTKALSLSYEGTTKHLVRCAILENRHGHFGFRYGYFYYFFTAKHMSKKLTDKNVSAYISDMCEKLYREDYANIVVFLAYFSESPELALRVASACSKIFPSETECDFSSDINKINQIASGNIVEKDERHLEISEDSPEKARERAAEFEDRFSAVNDKNKDPNQPGHEINRAFKALQVAGQLLRTCQGTLDRDEKLRLAKECYGLGQRSLGFLLRMICSNSTEFMAIFQHAILGDKVSDAKAKELFYRITQFVAVGISRRVSNAVGNQHLRPTFQQLLESNRSTGNRLVDLAIRLDHFGELSIDELDGLKREFQKNLFVYGIIRIFVWHHLTYFAVDYKIKQKICSLMDFSMSSTQLLSHKSIDDKKGTSH